MEKGKYRFHTESLTFKKVEKTFVENFRKFLSHFALSLAIGILLFVVASHFFDPPQKQQVKEANMKLLMKYKMINNQLDQMTDYLAEIQNRDDNIYRPVFEAKKIPESIRTSGWGGSRRYADLSGYRHSGMLVNTLTRIDQINWQLYVQSTSHDDVIKMIRDKEQMLKCIPSIQPISTKDLTRFGSGFGYRLHPVYKYVRMHYGVDLTAPRGTNVYAAGDGVVTRAEWTGGLGRNVVINHGYSFSTVYGHLHEIKVEVGQKVKRGDVIGLVGSTGLSTSDHLHYEVRKNNVPVDPVLYYWNDLSDEEYENMIEASANAETHIFED